MQAKSLALGVSKVDPIPATLRVDPIQNIAGTTIRLPLKSLLHHMYLDSHGIQHPSPDVLLAGIAPLLTETEDLRFRGSGLGAHKEARIAEMNKWGRACCRWFLHDHCRVPFFLHLSQVLDRTLPKAFAESRVMRLAAGDTPDYFCARSTDRYYFAEAKGTEHSVGFGTKAFAAWRKQFTRVGLRRESPFGLIAVKGWIVATRLASDRYSKRVRSAMYVEDPLTPGESSSDDERWRPGRLVIAHHYGSILEKLRLPFYAHALREGVGIARDLTFPAGIWRCRIPPLDGHEFVGGYFGLRSTVPDWLLDLEPFLPPRAWRRSRSALDLSLGGAQFFGLELSRFKVLREAISGNLERLDDIRMGDAEMGDLGDLSILGDMTVWAPLDYFELEEVRYV